MIFQMALTHFGSLKSQKVEIIEVQFNFFIMRFLMKVGQNETSSNSGAKCPKCGSTNTDKQNNIWRCYDCDKEW